MEKLLIEEIISFCKGKVLNEGTKGLVINDISTDSRTVKGGELFIPLCGEKFDGHEFIQNVLGKGIQATLIGKNNLNALQPSLDIWENQWLIQVEDTLEAYQSIAKNYLNKLDCIKIAITGSNGKTSTKEIILSILSGHFKILANEGNLNNQIGVPKTVLKVNDEHELAIIEMGTGKKGDILKLSNIVEPDFGIITNIGLAHTEFFKELDDIASEKRDLFASFHENSVAILNEDDPYYSFLSEKVEDQCLPFSVLNRPKVTIIKNLGLDGYILEVYGNRCHYKLGGQHNIVNLHFGLSIAELLKVPLKKIITGIESIQPVKMRSETIYGDFILIKDCYNANPSSMKAGLAFFETLSTKGKKIAVLGDMLELGIDTKGLHKELGYYFATLNIHYLFTLGDLGKKIAEGAKEKGFISSRIFCYSDQNSLTQGIKSYLNKNDLVYFKASRGMELEKVAQALKFKGNEKEMELSHS